MSGNIVERCVWRHGHALWPRGERIEAMREELGTHGVYRARGRFRDARPERRVHHQPDDIAFRSEPDHTWRERAGLNLASYCEERVRQIDHDARDRDLGRNRILIRVRADDE